MQANISNVWDQVLGQLKRDTLKPTYETWLKHMKLMAFYDGTIVIAVPNQVTKEWIETHYSLLLTDMLCDLLGRKVVIELTVPASSPSEIPLPELASLDWSTAPEGDTALVRLNPKYTFETFVVGNSNRFAHAAALAVADAPARAYNPLFIYGGVGLGKTHLMQALGHHVLARWTGHRVMYVSSESFTNELIDSIRDDRMVDFRLKYRNIDVLLIDDIQFLAGKERTQEEFFHTFNALHEASKQIVISSDRPPKEIPTLEERLRSRFEWGLISDIQPPDLETRIAILSKKAQLERLSVPDDVMLYVATKIDSNIRELEGALIRLLAYSSLHNLPLSVPVAEHALKDILPNNKPRQITIDLIQQTVAEHYGLKVEDFRQRKRTKQVAFPRQIAMYLARELTDCSLPKIGEEFGGRDHTTVMHAHEKITRDIAGDSMLSNTITELTNKIRCGQIC